MTITWVVKSFRHPFALGHPLAFVVIACQCVFRCSRWFGVRTGNTVPVVVRWCLRIQLFLVYMYVLQLEAHSFIHSFTGSSHKRLYPYGLNIFTFWGRIITPRPYGIYKSKKYYGRAYSILFNYCLRPVLSSETAECSTTLAKINYVGSCCSSQAGHTLTSGFASSTICFLSGEYIMCQLKRLISNTELQLHCVSNNIIFQVQ